MTKTVWFDINDLLMIRELAQKYLKAKKAKFNKQAVIMARTAVLTMKGYFRKHDSN